MGCFRNVPIYGINIKSEVLYRCAIVPLSGILLNLFTQNKMLISLKHVMCLMHNKEGKKDGREDKTMRNNRGVGVTSTNLRVRPYD